jgi:hypothetical protein
LDPKEEVAEGCRKLHNEVLHTLCVHFTNYSGDKIEDEIGRACSMMGEMRNAYNILVGNPECQRPLGRPTHRWILGNWNGGIRDQWQALVNTIMNLQVP